jgi:hypothetical protein
VAKSLNESRRETAVALEQQVDRLVNEPEPARVKMLDARTLRGWPAVGPEAAGSASVGTQPGTDEHLERLV